MKTYRKISYILTIIVAIVAFYVSIRRILIKPETPVSPKDDTIKYQAYYQYNFDGDTAVFYVGELDKQTVRFLAVDSPEIDQEGYEEAKRYTDTILRNAFRITIELDPYSPQYDKYDRLLAWIWVDDELLQAKLISSGNAKISYLFNKYLYTDYLFSLQNVTQ
jgi:micrococcal nuclease